MALHKFFFNARSLTDLLSNDRKNDKNFVRFLSRKVLQINFKVLQIYVNVSKYMKLTYRIDKKTINDKKWHENNRFDEKFDVIVPKNWKWMIICTEMLTIALKSVKLVNFFSLFSSFSFNSLNLNSLNFSSAASFVFIRRGMCRRFPLHQRGLFLRRWVHVKWVPLHSTVKRWFCLEIFFCFTLFICNLILVFFLIFSRSSTQLFE